MRKLICVIKYDLLLFARYRANLVWMVATPLVYLVIGMVVSSVTGESRFAQLSGGASSPAMFSALGYAVFSFANYSWQCGQKVETEIVYGTLRTNFLLPLDRRAYICGLSISTILSSGLLSFLIIIGSVIGYGVSLAQLPLMIVTLVMVLAYYVAVALFASAISLKFRRASSLSSVLTFVMQLLVGLIVPVQMLPNWLKVISYACPTTWAIDSLRGQIMHTTLMLPLHMELIILAAATALMGFAASALLSNVMRQVARDGSLDLY